jgi:hypothetical protein
VVVGVGVASAAILLAGGLAVARWREPALCRAAASVDRLVVHRTAEPSDPPRRFTLPETVTLDRPADVRSVAAALCALPAMPDGDMGCPADPGVVQHLRFFEGSRAFGEVTARPGGCTSVDGLGDERYLPDPVWEALGRALHLPTPARTAFAGT